MYMKRVRRKWQAGMSLLEVLMTVMIVTGGLLVVMTSFVGIAKSNRYVEKMETANSLLRLELESVRNIPYVNIVGENTSYGTAYSDQPEYRKKVIVSDLGNVKRITVQVFFDGDKHLAEATTMVAQM